MTPYQPRKLPKTEQQSAFFERVRYLAVDQIGELLAPELEQDRRGFIRHLRRDYGVPVMITTRDERIWERVHAWKSRFVNTDCHIKDFLMAWMEKVESVRERYPDAFRKDADGSETLRPEADEASQELGDFMDEWREELHISAMDRAALICCPDLGYEHFTTHRERQLGPLKGRRWQRGLTDVQRECGLYADPEVPDHDTPVDDTIAGRAVDLRPEVPDTHPKPPPIKTLVLPRTSVSAACTTQPLQLELL